MFMSDFLAIAAVTPGATVTGSTMLSGIPRQHGVARRGRANLSTTELARSVVVDGLHRSALRYYARKGVHAVRVRLAECQHPHTGECYRVATEIATDSRWQLNTEPLIHDPKPWQVYRECTEGCWVTVVLRR